jgi:hypothetical protein
MQRLGPYFSAIMLHLPKKRTCKNVKTLQYDITAIGHIFALFVENDNVEMPTICDDVCHF